MGAERGYAPNVGGKRREDDELCAVVLAAGRGTRLRPLTSVLPKALCPVGNVALVDLALASVRPFAADVAVNVHHLSAAVVDHLSRDRPEVHVSDETDRLLGSAGALGRLKPWIDGRAVLVRNSDAYLTGSLTELVEGWDGQRPRLLGRRGRPPPTSGTSSTSEPAFCPPTSSPAWRSGPPGLYDLVWRPHWERGEIEFVMTTGEFVDCGTPRDYLRANLVASGGRSVIGAGARVLGSVVRTVVWPGGEVAADEVLHDCIRVGRDLTVDAR
ncbi:MAG: NTP transferase domain-containing protein [Actinobacteria bacterium]|nr:NTP transferase domain-containing protein [Actinomycetota bacterium]